MASATFTTSTRHSLWFFAAILLASCALLACEQQTQEAEATEAGKGAEADEAEGSAEGAAGVTEATPEETGGSAAGKDEPSGGEGTTAAEPEGRANAPSGDDGADEDEPLADETLEALEALGYFEGAETDNPETKGVSKKATDDTTGLNVYTSRYKATAVLVDMDGEVVHEWRAKDVEEDELEPWMHVEPLPDGDLLIIARDKFLARRNWDSDLVWKANVKAHHDMVMHPDGKELWVLVRDDTTFGDDKLPLLVDSVVVLDASSGEELRRVDLLPVFEDHVDRGRLNRVRQEVEQGKATWEIVRPGGWADVFHTNSIEFLHSDIEGVAPKGAVIFSSRATSRVFITDAEMKEILWSWGGDGNLDGQHDAKQLPNGNLLIFDNGLARDTLSRVIELDPKTNTIVWTTEESMPELFTEMRGGAQLLENGNVLITESDRGHALEVTRDGEVVWEYWSPEVSTKGELTTRGAFYRFNRFPKAYFAPLK